MRTQAGQQHTQPKRLCDIVVGTRFETEDRVGVAVRPGQHHDRHQHPEVAQQTAQLAPIHVGQPDVEDDRIEPLVSSDLERLRRGSALDADELLIEFELFRQRLAQRDVIVDDQDFATSPHNLPHGAAVWPRSYPGKRAPPIPK